MILRCIQLVQVNVGKLPNWQLRNNEGQTMMHLAAAMGYTRVIGALVAHGARIDLQDVNGMTPLHFAALNGRRRIVKKLLKCHADPFHRTFAGKTVMDVADRTVRDVLPLNVTHREYYQQMNRSRRSSSSSTLASIFSLERLSLNDNNGGLGDVSLSRSPSGMSLDNYSDREYESSEYRDSDSEDFIADVRSAMRHRAPSNASATSSLGEDDLDTVAAASAKRGSASTAENISQYLSQLTLNARNRMNWDPRGNWDDVINYVLNRRKPRQRRTDSGRGSNSDENPTSTSDSDATVAPARNISRMWQYFTHPLEGAARPGDSGSTASTSPTCPRSPPPPRYEEIFPDRSTKGATASRSSDKPAVGTTSARVETATTTNTDNAEEQENTQTDEQQLMEKLASKRKQLRNDRMLFLFWLPVLLIAIVYAMMRFTGTLPEYGNMVSTWLGKQIGDYPVELLNRFVPAPRTAQRTFYGRRAAT